MKIFLNYREKYYDLTASNGKSILAGYLSANNGTGIKAKLAESKHWWSKHKDKAIHL
jgi:hypothetical protein